MPLRLLSPLLAAALVLTSSLPLSGCATTSAAVQRRECRQLRGRAVTRAIGLTLGAFVVLGVVIVAAAAGATGNNFPNFGGGAGARTERRQARRAARLAACRDAPRNAVGSVRGAGVEGQAVAIVGVVDIPIVAVSSGPPSVEELDDAIQPHADAVRACVDPAAGTLYVDARIDGLSGAVVGVVLPGSAPGGVSPACVFEALQALRVRRFDGVVDVRWAIEVTQPAP